MNALYMPPTPAAIIQPLSGNSSLQLQSTDGRELSVHIAAIRAAVAQTICIPHLLASPDQNTFDYIAPPPQEIIQRVVVKYEGRRPPMPYVLDEE